MISEHQKAINFLYHIYWLKSDLMKKKFHETFKTQSNTHFDVDQDIYMRLWYATLYCVVEGYQKLELYDSKVDELLKSPNLDSLRKFRHSVTGFHKNYYNVHLISPFLDCSKKTVLWINYLHYSLGKYLRGLARENSL
jgi:hypothetical protein